MTPRAEKYGAPWSRDELILAFELYCRIPFKATRASNPDVQQLATLLKRTPAGVARKLGNFGAFDPTLKKRGITGLVHTSKLDRAIWDEFHRDWPTLVSAAFKHREVLECEMKVTRKELRHPAGPSERVIVTRRRLHQSFFREAVLSSYEQCCCVTGVPVIETLIASHIIPWSVNRRLRADPTNGLCLTATFDRLFDTGLMCIEDDLSIRLSHRVLRYHRDPVVRLIGVYHKKPLRPPTRFSPRSDCLRWHRDNVFVG